MPLDYLQIAARLEPDLTSFYQSIVLFFESLKDDDLKSKLTELRDINFGNNFASASSSWLPIELPYIKHPLLVEWAWKSMNSFILPPSYSFNTASFAAFIDGCFFSDGFTYFLFKFAP